MLYAVLRSSGYPTGGWLLLGQGVWGKVALLSVFYLACALACFLVWTDNRNLSELAAESAKSEKMKNRRDRTRMGIAGMILAVLDVLLQFPHEFWSKLFKKEETRLMAAFAAFVIGLYLLVTSGMSVVLSYMKRHKKYYYKHALFIRSVMFRVSAYRNTIFAVLLINDAVLFSVGDSVVIFPGEEEDYSWRYAHDLIGSMTEEGAGKWRTICQESGGDKELISIPYLELQSETRRRFIGISQSSYKKLTGEDIHLEKDQISVCVQYDKADAEAALANWEDEENVMFRFGEKIKDYTVRTKEVEVLTVGGIMDESPVDVAVFEDGEHQELMRKQDTSELLVLHDFEDGKEAFMDQAAEDFKRENPQISCVTKTKLLNIEKLVDGIFNVINIFCILCLVMTGLSMLGVKLFSEIPALKKKYGFLSDTGMEKVQIKKEAGREIRYLIFIPAVLGAFMAAVYKISILGFYIKYHYFYNGNNLFSFIWVMSRNWLCVLVMFALVQLLYGRYILSYVRRKVVLAAFGKEEAYEKKQGIGSDKKGRDRVRISGIFSDGQSGHTGKCHASAFCQ